MTKKIPWARVWVEATVIVTSILLAFGIDAWWQRQQRVGLERDYLVALLADVETVISVSEERIPLQIAANQVSDSIVASLGEGLPSRTRRSRISGQTLDRGTGLRRRSMSTRSWSPPGVSRRSQIRAYVEVFPISKVGSILTSESKAGTSTADWG